MGLVVTVVLMLNLSMSRRVDRSFTQNMRSRVLAFLEERGGHFVALLAIAFLLLSALLLTGSRGGVLSTGSALLLVFLITLRKRSSGKIGNYLPILLLLFALVGTVWTVSSGMLQLRFDREISGDPRQDTYVQTARAIYDHLFVGAGAGSFPQIFPLYRDSEMLQGSFWTKAHNTYLETVLDLGLPAALVLFASILWMVWRCWQGLKERSRDRHFVIVGLSVSFLVGLHALVDFSLQIPAVSIAYMFLMGIAVAQSFSSRRH